MQRYRINLVTFGSYWVYFWTNENEPLEPVHVCISQGNPSENSTKVWINKSGKYVVIGDKIYQQLHFGKVKEVKRLTKKLRDA